MIRIELSEFEYGYLIGMLGKEIDAVKDDDKSKYDFVLRLKERMISNLDGKIDRSSA